MLRYLEMPINDDGLGSGEMVYNIALKPRSLCTFASIFIEDN